MATHVSTDGNADTDRQGPREETAAAAVTVTDVGDGVGGGAVGFFCVDAGDEAGCLPDKIKQNNVL